MALLFIGLKLNGHLEEWSWVWVLAPLWIWIPIVASFGAVGFLIAGTWMAMNSMRAWMTSRSSALMTRFKSRAKREYRPADTH